MSSRFMNQSRILALPVMALAFVWLFFGAGCVRGGDLAAEQTPAIDVGIIGEAQRKSTNELDREPPKELAVPILVYHYVREPKSGLNAVDRQYEVSPEQFAEQLSYLKDQRFESVSLADVAAAFSAGRKLPEKPVVITFDDGRDSQYTNAFTLLKEYGFTATFFVFTNAVGRPDYLTWEQLAEMRDAGMEIGSHTVYHPYLTKSSDEELASELIRSRAALQEKLDVPGDVIAYPFGLHDERVVAAARDAGYVAGRDLRHTIFHTPNDVLTLGSYIVTGDTALFAKILAGGVR